MDDPFLIEPSEEYQHSFERYVSAYQRIHDGHYYNKYRKAADNFQEYLNDLSNSSRGIGLVQGEVATSTYWLIDQTEVVGVVRVRHAEMDTAGHIGYDISPDHRNKGYGSQILKLALEKAFALGIHEVVITCNVDNLASKKVIEKNRGKFVATIFDDEENEFLCKFIISAPDR